MILNLELSKEEVIKFILTNKIEVEITKHSLNGELFIFISPRMQTIEQFSKEIENLIHLHKDEDTALFLFRYIEIQKNRITFILSGPTLKEYQFKSDIDFDDFEKLLLGLNF